MRDLTAAGLVNENGVVDGVFTELLAQNAPVVRTGVDRFLVDGRIAQYPAKPSDRVEILEWAAARVADDHPVDEATITSRLAEVTDDPASLRRCLVDANLIERDADGTAYRLNPAPRPASL